MLTRSVVVLVSLLLALTGVALAANAAPVRQATDWELLDGPSAPIIQLWALPDGTVFAADGDHALYSSADLGATWQAIAPPAGGWATAPDPIDAATVYGAASAGLFKSTDGGASWTLIRPAATAVTDVTISGLRLAISPADNQVLYLVEPLASLDPSSIVRSTDGGASWVKATDISRAGSPCGTLVSILIAHPLDPQRVFSNMGCYAGRNFGQRVSQSFDQGTTWSTVFRDGQGLSPRLLIGGGGGDPSRFYLTTSPFMGGSAARLYRSDDDAANWTEVLEGGDPQSTRFGGLAYDPDQPDTVFVATGPTPNPDDTGVRATWDGGQTWAFFGRQDIGWVNSLVRAPDGTLLAATNEGIWRLAAGY
ncbi:MAG TPA: hypothetical protein VGQ62_23555 [Chloroflexota bacterium]|nr:hypothetical protein [Chloroflexota bacterium]